jgi:hypothetical protein
MLGAVGERTVGDLVPEREPAGLAPIQGFDERNVLSSLSASTSLLVR